MRTPKKLARTPDSSWINCLYVPYHRFAALGHLVILFMAVGIPGHFLGLG
jgi:hypothetical protein